MSDKIPLHYTPKALTPEEREFATALGHEVSRALAVAVANPEMSFPAGSLAGRVQKTCRKMLTRPKAAAAQARAAKLLKADVATRRKYFGNAGNPGSDATAVAAAGKDLSVALKTKLAKAVNARLSNDLSRIDLKGLLPRTKVETGFFSGDVVTEGTNGTGLYAPEKLEFRWSTTEVGANAGKWQLVKKGTAQLLATGQTGIRRGQLLASGNTGAPGSIFTIDLPKWLPPKPPPTGAEFYEVRVAAYKHTPTSQTPWQMLGRTPWQMLGDWSPPVTIRYFKSDTPFHFQGANVLTSLACKLTEVELNIDSNESGGEEFHIAGFLAETRSNGSTTAWDFQFYQELDIDTDKNGSTRKHRTKRRMGN